MSDRPGPYELWRQAGGGTPTYSAEEYHRLMVSHGHLVPRPACTCTHVVDDPASHEPACPRYQDNDRRLPCGWLPGQDKPQRLTVVVTGDRNWTHPKMLRLVIVGLALGYLADDGASGFELLVGDCPTGADQETRGVCERASIPHRVFHARWDQMAAEGKPRNAAGPLRNREMLDALQAAQGERLVVAFHDNLVTSKGTLDCVREAKQRDFPVYLVSKL